MSDVTLDICYQVQKVEKCISINLNSNEWTANEPEISSYIFDPCTLIPEIQEMLLSQTNVEELLEGHAEINLEQEEIDIINYLTSSEYQYIKLTQIEDEYEKFPLLPFFTVERDNISYDSRTMGLGELSIFYFYWLYRFLSKANGRSFLLIEEPESFLPPAAQYRLMNVLAMLIAQYGIPTFMLSHSEHILSRVPRENIFIIKLTSSGHSFEQASKAFDHLKILGLNASKSGLILLEDEAAEILTKCLLKKSTKYVVDSFFYHISGSIGDIITDINRFPTRLEKFNFIGLLDGDAQSKPELKKIKSDAKFIFLPSELPPEKLIRIYFQTMSFERLASIFGIAVGDLQTAIENVTGLDHHDYFVEFAKQINSDFTRVYYTISDHWVNDPSSEDAVRVFLKDLENIN